MIASLLNSWMNSSSFLVVFLGFSVYSYVICKIVTIYFFFSNLVPFISFSCLIAVARTSNKTYVEWKWKSGHPCLVPDLRAILPDLFGTRVGLVEDNFSQTRGWGRWFQGDSGTLHLLCILCLLLFHYDAEWNNYSACHNAESVGVLSLLSCN